MSQKLNFVEELQWRGMIHDVMPGTKEQFAKEMTTAYVGFDPTAESLHVGNLVPIMLLKHLQVNGHQPIALVGGATGMVGDPSGKKEERKQLKEEVLNHNVACIRKQLSKFLDFENGANKAIMTNNYDWFKEFSLLGFLRDVGKHITVSYMMSKDSVQNRLETGISFTEFSYQLIQGYDFYYLNKNMNAKVQMGGSDQWGNITTGTELIRRMEGGEAFALTCPLITKADGSKFGKSESGNVWLDAKLTSPYKFYQFWLNASDADAGKYIRIFTLLSKEEIEKLETEHATAPHLRILQKALAKEVTIIVHSEEAWQGAVDASEILFGNAATDTLQKLDEETLLSVFEGVPQVKLSKEELTAGINAIEFLSDKTQIFPSRGEARKMIQAGGVSINKEKIADINATVNAEGLLNNKYLLVQKGKKNYYLIIAE
ncbi:MAG: tyrosine--tRNA ligase [Bacteroidota bacterium]|jgi:tyrosyl-tRNA synthetase